MAIVRRTSNCPFNSPILANSSQAQNAAYPLCTTWYFICFGKIYCPNLFWILASFPGPWHYSKLLVARIWLAYRLVRHPRVLNTFDMKSKKYDKLGVVASELEKVWELPKKLINREVFSLTYQCIWMYTSIILPQSLDGMFFYGTDGSGTFLKVSINRQLNRQAQVSLLFILPNGTTYQLPSKMLVIFYYIEQDWFLNGSKQMLQILLFVILMGKILSMLVESNSN